MSNILERHLEENIEPNTSKQDYIDQAIQIFQDMKEEDIHQEPMDFKNGNKYCLNGLFSVMTGYRRGYRCDKSFVDDVTEKIGMEEHFHLSAIHQNYCCHRDFERMRTEAIEYMRSLK